MKLQQDSTPDTTPANWLRLTLDAWRLIRGLRDELANSRETLHVAIETIRERDRELAAKDAINTHLRAQLRALMSGRTVAEERQAIEAEQHGADETMEERAA